MDEESKVIDVVNGTFDPGGGSGPIALGYTGDTPPARVLVTHDVDGNHVATPYEGADEPAATSPEPAPDDAAPETEADVGPASPTTTATDTTATTLPEVDPQPE